MDIEKLIEQLNRYFEGETLPRGTALDAATALSALQAENTQLRAYLEYEREHANAADVAEVRHGRWMTTDAYPHHLYCSVCYKTYAKNAKWVNELDLPTNYCPNCGARMGKEDEHEAG